MALTKARMLLKLKYSQLLAETLVANTRTSAFPHVRTSPRCFSTVTDEKTTSQGDGDKSTQIDPKLKEEIDALNKEITDLKEKNGDVTQKYKFALADSENMRNRLNNEIADAKLFSIQSFCKDLLDVADTLDKATESVPRDEIEKADNPHLKNLYHGLTTMEAQLKTIFKRHGLQAVNPLNEQFDPKYHEAVFQQAIEGKEAGSIVIVSKVGYKLHDRLIRAAKVGIAK